MTISDKIDSEKDTGQEAAPDGANDANQNLDPAPGDEAMQSALEAADIDEAEENEPYLGPAWAVVMLVLYLLKELFPAEHYSLFWFFQIYILVLVVAITIFTLVKRYQFYKSEKLKRLGKSQGQ